MRKVLLAGLLLLAGLSAAAETTPPHVRNFGQVNQNLFRGGLPTDEALRELKAMGINLVIDLREDKDEQQRVEKLGMRYAHVPLRTLGAPRPAEIERALSLVLLNFSSKVYVHCLRGKDRTGTVVACYRIQHDGWDNERALAEAKGYGMSRLEVAMQSFILHFTPLALPKLGLPTQ